MGRHELRDGDGDPARYSDGGGRHSTEVRTRSPRPWLREVGEPTEPLLAIGVDDTQTLPAATDEERPTSP
ncbi:hypothetical protein SAMN04487819_12221 [Actinopolyspora alba]|uniref:Uncharacterized protein n=2 Tax=Actinopolyspora alba TaxID=673379 RepID=A0A1I2CHW7_9ACTN|nr:hypothetical protein SAMN04487819_12221 [Actinopolyspora alba]